MNDTTPFQTQVTPSSATIGDVVQFAVQLQDVNSRLEPTTLPKTVGLFEVRHSSFTPQALYLELQGFSTGTLTLPGLTLSYRDASGKIMSALTPASTITLQEAPGTSQDNGDIRGIKDVLGPVAWSPLWWVLLGVLLVGGVGAWLYRRKKELMGPPPPPPEPADVIALRFLNQLKESSLLEEGKFKEYYSALSDAVRSYFENGFQVQALERTSAELLRDIRKHAVLGAGVFPEIKNLIESCDLVKFAKFKPEQNEALQEWTRAKHIIEMTKPRHTENSDASQ